MVGIEGRVECVGYYNDEFKVLGGADAGVGGSVRNPHPRQKRPEPNLPRKYPCFYPDKIFVIYVHGNSHNF